MTLDLEGLEPWRSGDQLEIYSSNANTWVWANGNLPVGATSTAGLIIDWAHAGYPARALDPDRGDQLWITQLAARSSSTGVRYAALATGFGPAPVALPEGQAARIAGALAPVAPSITTTVDWWRSRFEAMTAQLGVGARSPSSALFVRPQPGGLGRGVIGVAPNLLAVVPPGAGDLDLGVLSYGNPFPEDWGAYACAQSSVHVEVAPPVEYVASVGTCIDAQLLASAPLSPAVGPVREPRIDGADALLGATGAGTTPTVTWSRPAFGIAEGYSIDVHRVTDAGLEWAATLITRDTRLRVPPGVLLPGQAYVLVISSRFASGLDPTLHPFRSRLPFGGATVVSGPVVP